MANSYKVPQDVEAEDKLIGPFSFRQFIYLGIVAMALAAAWGLFLLFPLLAVIPVPIVIFFGALALPLRKDQPMETYLAAMWQFYIKPRRRMWMADGVVSRITIDMPLVTERRLTKDITSDQAISQFDYLSQIADTGGWSSRGVTGIPAPIPVVDNPEDDILDGSSIVAQGFDNRLRREDDERREDLLARVHSGEIIDEAPPQQSFTPQSSSTSINSTNEALAILGQSAQPLVTPIFSSTDELPDDTPIFDPTPKYMQQHILQPFDPNHAAHPQPVHHTQAAAQAEKLVQKLVEPSASVATPAIMELAKGVSVETVAKQLHHEEVERHGDEVVINLH